MVERRVKLVRIGGSLHLRLHSFFRELLDLREGDYVVVKGKGDSLVVKKG